MNERSYRKYVWILAFLGLVLDQSTKYGVFAWLGAKDDQQYRSQVVPGVFELVAQHKYVDGNKVPHVNQGALFGLGQRWRHQANNIFAGISLLAAIAIFVWSLQRSTAKERSLCLALGLILGGTLGNLYDRLVFRGVRDFLHWHYKFEWPVFNVADCCLVLGAGLLLLQAFRASPETAKTTTEQTAEKAQTENNLQAISSAS